MKQISIGFVGDNKIVKTFQLEQDVRQLFWNLYSKNKDTKLFSFLFNETNQFVIDIYLDIFKEKANLVRLIHFDDNIYMEKSDCNYKNIGFHMVDKSDILLALWDGEFNAKLSGTGDIVLYAREKRKKVVHLFCEKISSLNNTVK